MSHPKTHQVQCIDCNEIWMMRSDGAKRFKGRCRPCCSRNQMMGNKYTLGHKLSTYQRERLFSAEARAKIGKANRLRIQSLETRKKISEGVLRVFTPELRAKMGDAHRGPKSSTWKGGVTPYHSLLRKSAKYRAWRAAVFQRDAYACVIGGKAHGNKIQADHIKRFSEYPHLRFDINNGRTLCEECHRKTATYGRKVNITP